MWINFLVGLYNLCPKKPLYLYLTIVRNRYNGFLYVFRNYGERRMFMVVCSLALVHKSRLGRASRKDGFVGVVFLVLASGMSSAIRRLFCWYEDG